MKLIDRTSPLAGLLLGMTLVVSRSAAADDWPQWRGPHRDGKSTETGLLKAWPADGPPLAWKTTGLGAGFASVAVVGDRLYTAGDRDSANFVIALNRADGKEVWSAKLGKAGAPGWGGFAGVRATPTLDGTRLYALGQYGELACLDAATGKEIWRKAFVEDLGGKVPEWGFSESALVDGDQVVCTPGGADGAIVALNKATGAVIWRSREFTDDVQYSSIVQAAVEGVPQYIQMTMNHVVGISPKDGKVLWKVARKGSTAVIPTPIYSDGYVYVTSGYGVGCNLYKITKSGDGFTAEQVYANKVMKNHHGGVVLVGDKLYGHGDYAWVCQDFKTGKPVWESRDLEKGSVTYADGHLILREEKPKGSRIVLAEASADALKIQGQFEQPEQTGKQAWTHPVVAGGRLYIRDQDLLLCYDLTQK